MDKIFFCKDFFLFFITDSLGLINIFLNLPFYNNFTAYIVKSVTKTLQLSLKYSITAIEICWYVAFNVEMFLSYLNGSVTHPETDFYLHIIVAKV